MARYSAGKPHNAGCSNYLRTGRIATPVQTDGIEAKFNPWHDPDDGRFTFAGSGRYSGGVSTREPMANSGSPKLKRKPKQPTRVNPSQTHGGGRQNSAQMSEISLTSLHREFLSDSAKYPARPGTRDIWPDPQKPEMSKWTFKDQFISGHSNALHAAASQFDVPVELVASVAHAELGNDVGNDFAYAVRSEAGRNLPDIPYVRKLNKPRDETSFGLFNIQQRRAAEILGYGDINTMTETARRTLIPTTRDPVAATFMLAKHLSDLRDLNFPGVAGKALTRDQMVIIAGTYPVGPHSRVSKKTIHKLGETYFSELNRVKILLNQ